MTFLSFGTSKVLENEVAGRTLKQCVFVSCISVHAIDLLYTEINPFINTID